MPEDASIASMTRWHQGYYADIRPGKDRKMNGFWLLAGYKQIPKTNRLKFDYDDAESIALLKNMRSVLKRRRIDAWWEYFEVEGPPDAALRSEFIDAMLQAFSNAPTTHQNARRS